MYTYSDSPHRPDLALAFDNICIVPSRFRISNNTKNRFKKYLKTIDLHTLQWHFNNKWDFVVITYFLIFF